MHYYQHHIGDFLKDTGHLSNEQLAVYMKLLWRYYLDEKPLEDDCEMLAFAVRSDEKTVRLLLRHFFVLTDDGWRQARCDKVIQDYHEKSHKASDSAKARWNKANAMRTHTERNADEPKNDANHKPIPKNQEPINKPPKPPKGECGLFLKFWRAYPKKVAKDSAQKAFEKRKVDHELLETMLNALAKQKISEAWTKENGQFVPNPATWLNGGRWMDEVESTTAYKPSSIFAGAI